MGAVGEGVPGERSHGGIQVAGEGRAELRWVGKK